MGAECTLGLQAYLVGAFVGSASGGRPYPLIKVAVVPDGLSILRRGAVVSPVHRSLLLPAQKWRGPRLRKRGREGLVAGTEGSHCVVLARMWVGWCLPLLRIYESAVSEGNQAGFGAALFCSACVDRQRYRGGKFLEILRLGQRDCVRRAQLGPQCGCLFFFFWGGGEAVTPNDFEL